MKKKKTMVVTLSTDELSEIVKKSVNEALDARSKNRHSTPKDFDEEFITPSEAATILRVSKTTIFNYERRGWLHRKKIGMKVFFTRKSIEDFKCKSNSESS